MDFVAAIRSSGMQSLTATNAQKHSQSPGCSTGALTGQKWTRLSLHEGDIKAKSKSYGDFAFDFSSHLGSILRGIRSDLGSFWIHFGLMKGFFVSGVML